MKPRINAAHYEAYRRAAELPYGQPVMLGGVKAIASGQLPGRLIFKINGRNREVFPGDARLLEMMVVEKAKQDF